MAKKKKKKFQKKQLISLFENGNYQKVISKIKQFTIEGMDTDELDNIITTSYKNLAQLNFEQGEITRAIRDINSLLQNTDDIEYQLIKLKYLCYIEHFEEALSLGETLISVKDKKNQKDAIFLYLMTKLYSGQYELASNLLKAIPISRQRYILGFKALLEENKLLALDYFNKCNPKAKVEKENIECVIAIVNNQKIDCHQEIKPLYKFLLTGEEEGVSNSKNFRTIKKEVKKGFSQLKEDVDIQNLLTLKEAIPVELILKKRQDKEQESRLIYNNILLLVEQQEYINALTLFLTYIISLLNFVESASVFIQIINHIEDIKNDDIVVHFCSEYLKRHHKKIAPHQIDYILLFLSQQKKMPYSLNLAKEYHRDNFIFFLDELPTINKFTPHYQISLNKALKKYSTLTNILLNIVINNIKSLDEESYDLTSTEEEFFLSRIYFTIELFKNVKNINRKYSHTIFKLLKVLALIVQSFSYNQHESIYLKLSLLIEQYIEYFKIDRFNLPIDIKALFVSISNKESVKNDDIYNDIDEEDYFNLAINYFLEEEEQVYDFDINEYDLSIVKQRCLKALESEEENPFKVLNQLHEFQYYRFKISTLLELLSESIILKVDHLYAIQQMLFHLKIDIYDSPERDALVSEVKQYAKIDKTTAMVLLKYALDSVATPSREYVWYLKWIDGFLALINTHGLEKNSDYKYYRELFLTIQEKKKFKSLNAKYKKIKKLKEQERKSL